MREPKFHSRKKQAEQEQKSAPKLDLVYIDNIPLAYFHNAFGRQEGPTTLAFHCDQADPSPSGARIGLAIIPQDGPERVFPATKKPTEEGKAGERIYAVLTDRNTGLDKRIPCFNLSLVADKDYTVSLADRNEDGACIMIDETTYQTHEITLKGSEIKAAYDEEREAAEKERDARPEPAYEPSPNKDINFDDLDI